MFGKKKPTIFDENQDKALKAQGKNLAVLIKNNDYFIKTLKNQWSWINQLKQRVATLEATLLKVQQKDAQFAKMFAAMSAVSQQATEEVKQS